MTFDAASIERVQKGLHDDGTIEPLIELFHSDALPVDLAITINKLVQDTTGKSDPYFYMKKKINDMCAELAPMLDEDVAKSNDQIERGLKYAIAGNILDFGIFYVRHISMDRAVDLINAVMEKDIAGDSIEIFKVISNNVGYPLQSPLLKMQMPS